MCGIVGHVTDGLSADRESVEKAMNRLAHRGPDGEGIRALPDACLGHRRLSIIDLVDSKQPQVSADGRFTIVFNGEIYNYVELRENLRSRGAVFRTRGDTEVLLQMFIQSGHECLSELNGMYAFAIWDNLNHSLFIARDRVGKKPLFYAHHAKGFVFASELTGMLAFDWIDRSLNTAAVNRFFAHQFIGGEETIYRGIRQLLPGHYLFYRNGVSTIRSFWKPPLPDSQPRSLLSIRDELISLVKDAVRLRLRSDVPLGAFLSGGLDSSIIVSAMAKAGGKVHTFCVGFGEASFDETVHARQSADFYGTIHHDGVIDWDLEHSVSKALDQFGEPFADPSAVPEWHLCRHTRESVKVALSGDGADELFGGYRRYFARQLVGKWLAIPKAFRKLLLEPFVAMLPEDDRYYAGSGVKKLKLFLRLSDQVENSPGSVAPQTFSFAERIRLFNPDVVRTEDKDLISEFGFQRLDPVTQMMLSDVRTYLTDDILVKMDRTSMAHGLEARSPFLDYRLVEFACRLPLKWKIRGKEQKFILREAFRGELPPGLLDRPKHGFAVPLGAWFRGPLKSFFKEVVLALPTPEPLNRLAIEFFWQEHQSGRIDHGFKLWSLLAYHYWYHSR